MEQKTQVFAPENIQEIVITRLFDLPVSATFMAYEKAEIVEQWMGTKVVALESRNLGHYHFITTDPAGNEHHFQGCIHEFEKNQKITRTFEMKNTGFPVQLEFLEFEDLGAEKSKLSMKIVFRTLADRDNLLKLPFAMGINMAHNKLQEIAGKIKS